MTRQEMYDKLKEEFGLNSFGVTLSGDTFATGDSLSPITDYKEIYQKLRVVVSGILNGSLEVEPIEMGD